MVKDIPCMKKSFVAVKEKDIQFKVHYVHINSWPTVDCIQIGCLLRKCVYRTFV